MIEFKAQVSGHEATEKASIIQVWQGLSDWQPELADRFDRDKTRENGCENRFLSRVRSAAMHECEP